MLTKDQIIKLLETNDRAIGRALLVLLSNQTLDEQIGETVKHHNGKGFRPCHGRVGTSMANFFQRRGFLTPKQVAFWRRPNKDGTMKIAIYWKQLAIAAEQKKVKNM